MKYGYARVSTTGQSLESQIEQLEAAGCHRIKSEKMSGKTAVREELQGLLQHVLGQGDTLVVCKLDRLARSTADLLKIAEELEELGAGLEVLNINLDTKTPTGKLMLTMLGAIAQFERELMLERQAEGIAKAKAAGKYKGGAPVDPEKLKRAEELVEQGWAVTEAVKVTGISRAVFYKYKQK
ncbi:recombinase family protein [Marinobacter sp. NSM]|uniref:recombinase family protein n=1 Tax=Marinobacter sp. NSM TaxID=3458004 RepID=UPI0040357B43